MTVNNQSQENNNQSQENQSKSSSNSCFTNLKKVVKIAEDNPVPVASCLGGLIGGAVGCGIASATGSASVMTSVGSGLCGALSAGVAAKQCSNSSESANNTVITSQPQLINTVSSRVAEHKRATEGDHAQRVLNHNSSTIASVHGRY